MSTYGAIQDVADRMGWDDATQLAIALRYVEQQADEAAFRGFLETVAEEEAEAVAEVAPDQTTSREARHG